MTHDTYDLDRFMHGDLGTDITIDRRRHGRGVAYEGDNGVFTQTWWPICRSSDLAQGQVIGRNFLDGRVAIFRGADGTPNVVSAYCPHNGADLSVGRIEEGHLVCAFHEWKFNTRGRCIVTGSGDPVVEGMKVFRYPTQERFGLVWAFNGDEPLFDLPTLEFPDDELVFHEELPIIDLLVDPWVFMCNTSDINHITCVHKLKIETEDPASGIQYSDFGYSYDLRGRIEDADDLIEYKLGIAGSNIYFQTGTAGGHWFAFLYPCGLHRPGTLRSYVVIATRKSNGTPEDDARARAALDYGMALEKLVVSQDRDILNTIRFSRGMFTRSDRALGRFLDYLQKYPRAHPGRDYIR